MTERASSFLIDKKTAKALGFKALLAWHYLVLFTPTFMGNARSEQFQFFFDRQFVLYLSIAITFAILAPLGKRLTHEGKALPSMTVLVFAFILATASSMSAIICVGSVGIVFKFVLTISLGVSEALLMFLWLHYYTMTNDKLTSRSFAIDMIFGGLLAFLICVLQYPFSYMAAVVLPFMAGASLLTKGRASEAEVRPRAKEPQPEDVSDRRKAIQFFLGSALPPMIYAFVFGLLQGGYIVKDIPVLMAFDPLILTGILICGALVLVVFSASEQLSMATRIHGLSLVL